MFALRIDDEKLVVGVADAGNVASLFEARFDAARARTCSEFACLRRVGLCVENEREVHSARFHRFGVLLCDGRVGERGR